MVLAARWAALATFLRGFLSILSAWAPGLNQLRERSGRWKARASARSTKSLGASLSLLIVTAVWLQRRPAAATQAVLPSSEGYSSLPRFGILGCESLAKDYLTRVGYDECVPAKLQSFSACETGAYPSLVADWACGCSPPRALTQILQTRARRRPRAPKTPGRVAGLVYGRSFLALLNRSRSAARRNSAAAYDTRSCVYARGTALYLFSKACHVASVKPTGRSRIRL